MTLRLSKDGASYDDVVPRFLYCSGGVYDRLRRVRLSAPPDNTEAGFAPASWIASQVGSIVLAEKPAPKPKASRKKPRKGVKND